MKKIERETKRGNEERTQRKRDVQFLGRQLETPLLRETNGNTAPSGITRIYNNSVV